MTAGLQRPRPPQLAPSVGGAALASLMFVRSLSPERLTRTGKHRAFGEMRVTDYLKVDLEHDDAHLADIGEVRRSGQLEIAGDSFAADTHDPTSYRSPAEPVLHDICLRSAAEVVHSTAETGSCKGWNREETPARFPAGPRTSHNFKLLVNP